jgi:hypothetical protein
MHVVLWDRPDGARGGRSGRRAAPFARCSAPAKVIIAISLFADAEPEALIQVWCRQPVAVTEER